ncbi:MAG: hypothetical protein AAFZ18_31855, partial [Myxococcota bacterium]
RSPVAIAYRTDRRGEIVEVRTCGRPIDETVERLLLGTAGLPKRRLLVARHDNPVGYPSYQSWRVRSMAPSTHENLADACRALPPRPLVASPEQRVYDRQRKVFRILDVRRASSPHVELLVTLENRTQRSQSLVALTCTEFFLDVPIPFAPGERRALAIPGPSPIGVPTPTPLRCTVSR